MSDFYEEACYLSNSEAEPDSETEDFTVTGSQETEAVAKPELAWDDPQALLNTWLGELDNLNMVSDATKFRLLFFSVFLCLDFVIGCHE